MREKIILTAVFKGTVGGERKKLKLKMVDDIKKRGYKRSKNI